VARIESAEVASILEGLCAAAQDTARATLERDESPCRDLIAPKPMTLFSEFDRCAARFADQRRPSRCHRSGGAK
jgi:hypothetical protein